MSLSWELCLARSSRPERLVFANRSLAHNRRVALYRAAEREESNRPLRVSKIRFVPIARGSKRTSENSSCFESCQ